MTGMSHLVGTLLSRAQAILLGRHCFERWPMTASLLALLMLLNSSSDPADIDAKGPVFSLPADSEVAFDTDLLATLHDPIDAAADTSDGWAATTQPPAPKAAQRDPNDVVVPDPWAALADCESGNWLDGGAAFEEGSARWDWAQPDADGVPQNVPPWGTTIHHGGLQFLPSTWDWVAEDLGLLDRYPYAYDAPVDVQIAVAVEVQKRQGWEAWPVCSRLVGLR